MTPRSFSRINVTSPKTEDGDMYAPNGPKPLQNGVNRIAFGGRMATPLVSGSKDAISVDACGSSRDKSAGRRYAKVLTCGHHVVGMT